MHGTFDRVRQAANQPKSNSAIYLTEVLSEMNDGASFLGNLSAEEAGAVRRAASSITLAPGESVFMQGEEHNGIFLIDAGRVRTYYAGPSGKEITLAYWTPGHFIGGPEVFGGGVHMWSAVAVEPSRVSLLPGAAIRTLVRSIPAFAVCLIDGLVAKGKCYSALVQMLGTRSVTERLARLLLILAEIESDSLGDKRLAVRRRITHEQLAGIVGSTRQWVTSTMSRLHRRGIVTVERDRIVIEQPEALREASF
jgi:CRP/FNR family cyclic AMP-dependent transcriptional regulator